MNAPDRSTGGDVLLETPVSPRRATPVKIPVSRYTSPAFFEREMAHMWPKTWQLACTVDHVANPGDWHEYRVGRLSVLVVRGDDGVLRAFQNVCLHRGTELCSGSGSDLAEIRCPFHRWTWGLDGRLREVPSRREFGVLNDDYPLIAVQVDTWGPLVFVNLDRDAEPLADYLAPVPAETEWANLGEFRCQALISVRADCNWKTLIEGFSETYHVQGIHREMLGMADDVNGPQVIWPRHGRLVQSYGLPSPRQGRSASDESVFASFVEVMGGRIGVDDATSPMPAVPAGDTLRGMLAGMVREVNRAQGIDLSGYSDHHVLDMEQYNLFPNITVLVFADMLSVVRARPGEHVEEAFMDVLAFTRMQSDHVPRTKPFDALLPADAEPPFGLVLNQDVGNFARTQRGLHQPGLTHLTISPTEECRIVNLHRTLEEFLGIGPEDSVRVMASLTLDDLIAREEIGDVVKDLARGTDRLDAELMASCYHPDGTDDHNVFRGTGTEFAQWVVDTLPHFAATMHFIGSPRVRRDDDVARVDTYCVAHHVSRPDDDGQQTDMVLGLRYVDRFEKRAGERRAGEWRIAARVCAFDWTVTVPFDPARGFTFETGWTLGVRDGADITYSDFTFQED